jgi:MoxR-like ATPase
MVMATQNPIEQEGTYALPEAQRDRFLLHIRMTYPRKDAERQILVLNRDLAEQSLQKAPAKIVPIIDVPTLMAARKDLFNVHLSEPLETYIVQLILATRDPKPYGDQLFRWLRFGASPRGTIALERASRAHAWLQGRDYVIPEDIHIMAPDVLRHRILLNFEAEAEGVDSDDFIQTLLQRVPVP